jgi:hypothetical protein
MTPITEETEYVTMSKDLFNLFIRNSFTGGVLYQLKRHSKLTSLSQDEAEKEMIQSALNQINLLK